MNRSSAAGGCKYDAQPPGKCARPQRVAGGGLFSFAECTDGVSRGICMVEHAHNNRSVGCEEVAQLKPNRRVR